MHLKLWRCDDGTYDVLDADEITDDGSPAIVAMNVPGDYITSFSVSKAKLWEAQLREWPDSFELEPRELYDWAASAKSSAVREQRYALLSMALQYPVHVFYRTSLTPGKSFMGCRYGTRPSEYLSNFI